MRNVIRLVALLAAFAVSAEAANIGKIVYSTHLTGVSLDGIAVDRHGNVYVTGSGSHPGIFVAKLNPAGKLVYSRYIGGAGVPFSGAGPNTGFGIAVDWLGNAYVTGLTTGDLPTTPNAFQPNPGNANSFCTEPLAFASNAFVIKLNGAGKLVYATYLGGPCIDWGRSIAVDLQGNAYVTGLTTVEFPTTPNALDTGGCFEYCGFVTKLNSSGSSAIFSTYLGFGDFIANSIAVDLFGHAYVTGYTTLFDGVPTTPNAFEPNWPGTNGGSAYVAKLNNTGSSLVYGTYLGGAVDPFGFSRGEGIAVDLEGDAYVTGITGDGFPTTPNSVQPTFAGVDSDAFVAKLNPLGGALVYSTYIGSESWGTDIAVDLLGNAYVAWGSFSGLDAKVAKLNTTGSSLINFGIGNRQNAGDLKIAADYFGNVYVATLDGSVTKISTRTGNLPLQTVGGNMAALGHSRRPLSRA